MIVWLDWSGAEESCPCPTVPAYLPGGLTSGDDNGICLSMQFVILEFAYVDNFTRYININR